MGGLIFMSKEPRSSRTRLLLVAVIALLIIPFGIAYRVAYYRTTTLTVVTPQLDWYAHRKFSSRAHYIVFLPMFYWESRYDWSNPGYVLQPDY